MRLFFCLLVCLTVAIQTGRSQDIVRIGLVDFSKTKTLKIRSVSGGYHWLNATGQVLDTLTESTQLSIQDKQWKGNNLPLEKPFDLTTHPAWKCIKHSVSPPPDTDRSAGVLHLFADSQIRCILETPIRSVPAWCFGRRSGQRPFPKFLRGTGHSQSHVYGSIYGTPSARRL